MVGDPQKENENMMNRPLEFHTSGNGTANLQSPRLKEGEINLKRQAKFPSGIGITPVRSNKTGKAKINYTKVAIDLAQKKDPNLDGKVTKGFKVAAEPWISPHLAAQLIATHQKKDPLQFMLNAK